MVFFIDLLNRLNLMSLISRLIGTQHLILMNFYSFMQKYLQPRQRDVTKILLYVAQSSHPFVPPDAMANVLRTIADNFVTDAHAGEVVAVGLNAIREVVVRCPLGLNDELAGDLIEYRKSRDKMVQMAARSLVQAIRDHNPTLLRKKDRGRPMEDGVEKDAQLTFGGNSQAMDYIPGAEIASSDDEVDDEDEGESAIEISDDEGEEVSGEDEVDSEKEDEDDDNVEETSESEEENGSGLDSDIDDEDGGKKKDEAKKVQKVLEMPAEERIETARVISSSKILDDEDFKRIKKLQMTKALTAAKKRKSNKNEEDEINDEVEENSEDEEENYELPRLKDIEKGCSSQKARERAVRIEELQKSRLNREKFGKPKGRMNPNASTTNREKQRNKAFLMVRQKVVKEKKSKSFQAKQQRLHAALLKLAKRGK